MEPDGDTFFKSLEKQGGPIFPDICFEPIYGELYVKKQSHDEDTQSEELSMSEHTKEVKNKHFEFDG